MRTTKQKMKKRENILNKNSQLQQWELVIKSGLNQIPLGEYIHNFLRMFRYLYWKGIFLNRSWRIKDSVEKIRMINPQSVKMCTPLEFHPIFHMGLVKDGNWDQTSIEFEQLDIFQAMKQRFLEGKAWRDTEFFKDTSERIESGEILWGCRSLRNFEKRCDQLDRLFHHIKDHGYKSQFELNGHKFSRTLKDFDELSVNIDRDGNMLFNNSAHRLAIAKLLNIEKVPAIITVRHIKSVDSQGSDNA